MFTPELTQWLQYGDRGISSNAIVEVMEGLPLGTINGRWGWGWPHDPADLRRCVLLLRAVPSYQGRIGELAQAGRYWAALVGAWAELEALLVEEGGPALDGREAPRTYARMRALLDQ